MSVLMIGFYESVCFLLMKCVSITWMGGDQESLTYNCGNTSDSSLDVAPSSLEARRQDFAV